jgi:hypothetical protein
LCEFGIVVITIIVLCNDFQRLRTRDTDATAFKKVIGGIALTAFSFVLSVITFVLTVVNFNTILRSKQQQPNEAAPRESRTGMDSAPSCAPLACQSP